MAKKKKEEVAVVSTSEGKVVKRQEPVVPSFDMSGATDLPNLYDARIVPADLSATYWSPEEVGESIRGFIQPIEEHEYQDRENEGKIIKLPTMLILAQNEDGDVQMMKNASKRLVADVERNFNEGKIQVGTPLIITYTGDKKNSTNSNKSRTFSVKPISA